MFVFLHIFLHEIQLKLVSHHSWFLPTLRGSVTFRTFSTKRSSSIQILFSHPVIQSSQQLSVISDQTIT